MTAPQPPVPASGQPAQGPLQTVPNAEKYVLEADALRRRQLRSALLHGSDRTWREQRRIWPAAIGGIIAMIVIVAVVAVLGALNRQQEIDRQKAREQQQLRQPAVPAATASR